LTGQGAKKTEHAGANAVVKAIEMFLKRKIHIKSLNEYHRDGKE
jgi:hypothetical protein